MASLCNNPNFRQGDAESSQVSHTLMLHILTITPLKCTSVTSTSSISTSDINLLPVTTVSLTPTSHFLVARSNHHGVLNSPTLPNHPLSHHQIHFQCFTTPLPPSEPSLITTASPLPTLPKVKHSLENDFKNFTQALEFPMPKGISP